MNRTLNTELLKRLRSDKGWSQEELAIAADLSTRTIQRLETVGSGSINSIKSIASALEVEMHNIEEKPRTQLVGVRWGYTGVALGTVCAVIAIILDWTIGDGTNLQAGLSMGIIGALAGTSCAFINWASNR